MCLLIRSAAIRGAKELESRIKSVTTFSRTLRKLLFDVLGFKLLLLSTVLYYCPAIHVHSGASKPHQIQVQLGWIENISGLSSWIRQEEGEMLLQHRTWPCRCALGENVKPVRVWNAYVERLGSSE